MYTKFTLC